MATLPLARSSQQGIDRFAGKWIYIVLVGLLIALYLAVSARYVMHATHVRSANIIWFAAVSAIVMGITATARTPIEGLHFIQYGVLGLLAYRALSHRTHDLGVYLSATLIATIVGIIDEAVQWILPNRVWDIRDILFNLSGSLMVQFAIGLGFRLPGPQLDQLRADGGYIQFLREHRSRLDPVAHEAAVHLARRNYYRGLESTLNEPNTNGH